MKGLLLGILGGCWLVPLLMSPAWAAEPAKPPTAAELTPKVRPSTTSYYGWKILATGGVGSVLVTAGVLLPDKPLGSAPATAAFVIGAPLFVVGGPAVHWSHGNFGKGLVSFGGNLALPLIGGFSGRAIRCNEANAPDDCASRGFLTGLAFTAMITSVVDAVVLGWEEVPVEDAVYRFPGAGQVSIGPWSSAGNNGLQVGLAGRF